MSTAFATKKHSFCRTLAQFHALFYNIGARLCEFINLCIVMHIMYIYAAIKEVLHADYKT